MGPDDVIRRNVPAWEYQQLADILEARIKRGDWEKGTLMPSENWLMQEYGLARGTVRKALSVLEERGLIYKIKGRGTVVK